MYDTVFLSPELNNLSCDNAFRGLQLLMMNNVFINNYVLYIFEFDYVC